MVSVARKSTDLDLRGQFTVEAKNPTVDALFVIKYGDDKEVSVSVFWSYPRTTLTQMEGRINVTVPTFSSMILQGKLEEKAASDYIVSFHINYFCVSKRRLQCESF